MVRGRAEAESSWGGQLWISGEARSSLGQSGGSIYGSEDGRKEVRGCRAGGVERESHV